MNNGIDIFSNGIDIVFLALIAGFLVLRLRSVLGRRTGREPRPEQGGWKKTGQDAEVFSSPSGGGETASPHSRDADLAIVSRVDASVEMGLTQVKLADPSFKVESFLTGAQTAFRMIIEGFASRDRALLRQLLSDEVFSRFDAALSDQEAKAVTMQARVAGMQRVSIIGATLDHSIASITVRFVSEQIVSYADKEGRIIEGDPTESQRIVDDWTFVRDIRQKTPDWKLSATATPKDAAS